MSIPSRSIENHDFTPCVVNMRNVGWERYNDLFYAGTHIYVGNYKAKLWHFGNPFTAKRNEPGLISVDVFDPDSEDYTLRISWEELHRVAAECYKEWLCGNDHHGVDTRRRKWILDNLGMLRGKKLIDYQSPMASHADYLLEIANIPQATQDAYLAKLPLNTTVDP
jgi:hypothetical protein